MTVLGEAASKVSSDCRRSLVEIPWRAIIDTRNHLIHSDDVVNLNLLWETVERDLPKPVATLEAKLSD